MDQYNGTGQSYYHPVSGIEQQQPIGMSSIHDVSSNGIATTSVMEWSECTQNDVISSSGGVGGNHSHPVVPNNGGGAAAISSVHDHHHHHNHQRHHHHHHHNTPHSSRFPRPQPTAAPTIKNHSVTHFNGYLYCFGGYDGRRNHMTLLLYSIKHQRWIRPYHITTPSSLSSLSTTPKTSATTSSPTTTATTSPRPEITNNRSGSSSSSSPSAAIHAATSAVSSITSRAAVAAIHHHSNSNDSININHNNHSLGYNNSNSNANNSSSNSNSSSNDRTSPNPNSNNDTSIVVHGTPPPGRNGHTATLATDPDDDQQGRIIIIGGWLGTGPLAASDMHVLEITHIHNNNNHNTYRNDTNGSNPHNDIDDSGADNDTTLSDGCRQVLQWYQPAVKGTPPGACNMHSADYVSNRKEVYVFRGGNGREYLNDLHALHVDTLTWRKVQCSGTVPQQRANHSSAILDKPGKKSGSELFIFGGWNGTERLNDIHILDTDTSTWTAPHVAGVLPHPRAGMTLTALRGRLYLFGGSGTSAKCFQDLQILDRHEMAWLDVVSDDEKGGTSTTNTSPNNANNTSNNNEGGVGDTVRTDNIINDHRFRFGGSQMYRSENGSLLLDDYGGGNNSNVDILVSSRPQQGGSSMDVFSSSFGNNNNNIGSQNVNGNGINSVTPWRSGHDIDSIRSSTHLHHHMYASPNPNDEDTVPSVLVRGPGPGRRAGHTATAVNRKIYIFGGSCGSDYLNDFFVLDTDPPPSAVVTEANPLLLMERRLRHFFNDPEFADVVFVVGDHQDKVYGHKMVLSIVSDCFRAMFTTGFKEADAMEITIPDCTHSAFLAVMEYIYTGALPFILRQYQNNTNTHLQHGTTRQQQEQNDSRSMNKIVGTAQMLPLVVEILELADRFFLDHLKQVCERILQTAVNGETVEFLLSVAQKSNSIQLLSICQHYCRNNRLPQSTGLLSLSTSTTSNSSATLHHLNQIHYPSEPFYVNPNDDILPSSSSND